MKRKSLIVLIILAALIIAAGAIIIKRNADSNIYYQGLEFIQDGNYYAAKEKLLAVKGYKDTKDLLKECNYQIGVSLFEGGQEDEAYEELSKLDSYKDSPDYVKKIKYNRLNKLIQEREYDDAIKLADEIIDYSDTATIKQEIYYDQYMDSLNIYDLDKAQGFLNKITDESIINRAHRVREYIDYGYSIISDAHSQFDKDGNKIEIKDVRCYQYSYNNNVEVPVYMIYTVITDSEGNKSDRYIAYVDKKYYGYCDSVDKTKINLTDEAQLYSYLKIGPYWDDSATFKLSPGAMEFLAAGN